MLLYFVIFCKKKIFLYYFDTVVKFNLKTQMTFRKVNGNN